MLFHHQFIDALLYEKDYAFSVTYPSELQRRPLPLEVDICGRRMCSIMVPVLAQQVLKDTYDHHVKTKADVAAAAAAAKAAADAAAGAGASSAAAAGAGAAAGGAADEGGGAGPGAGADAAPFTPLYAMPDMAAVAAVAHAVAPPEPAPPTTDVTVGDLSQLGAQPHWPPVVVPVPTLVGMRVLGAVVDALGQGRESEGTQGHGQG